MKIASVKVMDETGVIAERFKIVDGLTAVPDMIVEAVSDAVQPMRTVGVPEAVTFTVRLKIG